jgi:hypothetical protein
MGRPATEILIGQLDANTVGLHGLHMIGCPAFIGGICRAAAQSA